MTPRRSTDDAIRLRGVRHNNLKNFDLDIPIGKLTVITGLSGSGKSSLAFDTLFAEGQRRYIETFSPYARQFFDRMDKPQVDRIEGIPPAIAIEQRNAVRSTRSTVGTMTEICDYLKVVWPHLSKLHCRNCGKIVRTEPPQVVWEHVQEYPQLASLDVLVTFNLPLSDKLSLADSLALVARQGYQRLLIDGQVVRLEDASAHANVLALTRLTIIQDRLKLAPGVRSRFIEACEQAYHFGQGKLTVLPMPPSPIPGIPFSRGHHCAACDLDYPKPTSALFSFNHPLGACPACKGFGRIISIDYHLALPDRRRTLAQGAVKPWQTGMSAECQVDLAKAAKTCGVPMDVPFAELTEDQQHWVIDGEPGYDANDPKNSWPRKWYGVKGYFRSLESKSYKMHVRVLLSRYRAYTTCGTCGGRRLQPEALLYRVPWKGAHATLPDFYALCVDEALHFVNTLATRASTQPNDPLALALGEVRARLRYLVEVGLGYLALDRPTRTLSGGETERVNLTTCLGTRLVNTLFVLDEPSVGLHPRDTARLVRILHQLRDTGNTVVVVEHEAGVIRAADRIVDLGPGQGEKGGSLVFCGPLSALLRDRKSITGAYLSGRRTIQSPPPRPVVLKSPNATGESNRMTRSRRGPALAPAPLPSESGDTPALHEAIVPYQTDALAPSNPQKSTVLRVRNARCHNLRNVTVEIPLGRFVALTGVSGSGKTTLVRDVLLPSLQARFASSAPEAAKASDRLDETNDGDDSNGPGVSGAHLEGWESLNAVVLVDQSSLGKTPRSNPVVYIGAFDDVRDLFAQTDLARQRGLSGSAFSFNSGVGQCERCRGAGFEKIEMQFLSDVFIRCPECDGRRYRAHILEVKLRGPVPVIEVERPIDRRAVGRKAVHATEPSGEERSAPAKKSSPVPNAAAPPVAALPNRVVNWSIADLLEATVDDALIFLGNYIHLPAGRRALARLRLLQDVGLGYLRLGQPINTLSGGESQRLKLVSHLAESAIAQAPAPGPASDAGPDLETRNTRTQVAEWLESRKRPAVAAGSKPRTNVMECGSPSARQSAAEARRQLALSAPKHSPHLPPVRGTLFLFDEPTTGLHFEDVRVLLLVFQRIVDAGHSVVVIEHNLDVIKCADWVIDLGPEAGEGGGTVVAAGTPDVIAACAASHTGTFLREAAKRKH